MRFNVLLIAVFAIALFVPHSVTAADAPRAPERVQDADATVTVYYFHGARRCKTCLSIERIARGVVRDKYGDDTRVRFRSVDIEKEKNEKLAARYEVAGSALMVCRGEKKKDLTTQAFQYALGNPSKLQKKLIAAIDRQLK